MKILLDHRHVENREKVFESCEPFVMVIEGRVEFCKVAAFQKALIHEVDCCEAVWGIERGGESRGKLSLVKIDDSAMLVSGHSKSYREEIRVMIGCDNGA